MIQQLKTRFDADDRAVSPVIGVILMVAITVILAAVIASLTLGLGDSAQTAPTAKFDFEQTGTLSDGTAEVTVSHASGATIANERVDVVYGTDDEKFGEEVSAGTSTVVDSGEISSGSAEEIKVVWTSEDGSTSTVLATYQIQ
ncbi:type IV pilin [Halomarina oriensis]|uniref:Type IV pilin n=1 Tax=Halomarina oriensis TaxID=671145 RepID=A0A6B0GGT0_9EURY|nr:type IV pilin N-terminal domain-containing protein [Halomarina oriensis]MWG32941.1 type IV pilin [Halomarina oriensis]